MSFCGLHLFIMVYIREPNCGTEQTLLYTKRVLNYVKLFIFIYQGL